MWKILGVTIVILIFVYMDGISLWKHHHYRALWTFLILMGIGTGLLIYQLFIGPIPTLLKGVDFILNPVTDSFYKLFE
ncbi:hypothetical protein FGG79_03680 [Bacillus sp. BHET2]|uniref:hypothetical protein n=1 Tax=Bacillus sp. BHET2 TaxID=2583818 RepID=UPI00110F5F32|nr:hypothetical protein [Bacillus sp. BHET2]TMU87244.1 hypothetical protein FGG79_03680 [Bacillus sp. BHET2]